MNKIRVRRTMQLAIGCISNIAAYRSNWTEVDEENIPIMKRDFWIRMN